jgi:uracil-DNA glycosylase
MNFDTFLRELGKARVSDRACNQYALTGEDAAPNRIRRQNLRLYLEEMELRRPRMILIGEAPSHRGGRLTGIAFLSEKLMMQGIAAAAMFGAEAGYRKATGDTPLSTEASASMVWETVGSMRPLPLLWNAFPFHPFQTGNPTSNRMPTRQELEMGRPFMRRLIRGFNIELVVAVGNHAHDSLTELGIEHELVRHPSMGGKVKFVEGMARVGAMRNAECGMWSS